MRIDCVFRCGSTQGEAGALTARLANVRSVARPISEDLAAQVAPVRVLEAVGVTVVLAPETMPEMEAAMVVEMRPVKVARMIMKPVVDPKPRVVVPRRIVRQREEDIAVPPLPSIGAE